MVGDLPGSAFRLRPALHNRRSLGRAALPFRLGLVHTTAAEMDQQLNPAVIIGFFLGRVKPGLGWPEAIDLSQKFCYRRRGDLFVETGRCAKSRCCPTCAPHPDPTDHRAGPPVVASGTHPGSPLRQDARGSLQNPFSPTHKLVKKALHLRHRIWFAWNGGLRKTRGKPRT